MEKEDIKDFIKIGLAILIPITIFIILDYLLFYKFEECIVNDKKGYCLVEKSK